LKIEQVALQRKKTRRLAKATRHARRKPGATREGIRRPRRNLESEKATLQGGAAVKEELDKVKSELEAARRRSDLARMAELQYGAYSRARKTPRRCAGRRDARQPVGAQQGD
jgi:ATP-dependent Clp protease ATP-binding subunit ClpB